MKIYLFVSVLLSIALSTFSQSAMDGHVYFLNSKHETGKRIPAIGVYVEATGSNGEYTKSDGYYRLRFSQFKPGEVVTLSVGEKDDYIIDQANKKLEWVNDKDMKTQTIPENPKDNPTNIIVCPKGYRDQIAQQYYNIIKTSTEIALAKKEKEYEELKAAQKKDWERINKLTNELAQLQKQADSLTIYKEAMQMASINKDDASKRVLKYLELLEEGKSIQEAREVLSIEDAAEELKNSTTQFKAAIEELVTRASASEAIFDYQDAIICYETIISHKEKINIDRLDLASTYKTVGGLYYDNGQYSDALEYHKKALKIFEEVLAVNDTTLASSYNYIAGTNNKMGKYLVAIEYHKKALNILEDVLEVNHPELASTYSAISQPYNDLGRYDKALEYNKKAIKINEEVLEANHPRLATSYHNVAITYVFLEKFEQAIMYFKKAIKINEEVLKANHPSLVASYNGIGATYYSQGEYKEALENFRNAITILEETLVANHPHLAVCYHNIASTYSNLERYEQALKYHKKAIKIRQEVLEINHPHLAYSYGSIASTFNQLKRYEEALKYHEKAIEIFEKVWEANHPHLGTFYNNIALTYRNLGKFEQALEYLKKVIKINEEVLEANHPHLAFIYNDIALTYDYLGRYEQAVEYHKKAIKINEEVLKANHPHLATSYNNLGLAFAKNRQFDEAYNAFVKYKEIHPDKGETYRNWAMYYALKGEKEKALLNLQKAIDLSYRDIDWLKTDESLDSLRAEKDFIKIIEELEAQE